MQRSITRTIAVLAATLALALGLTAAPASAQTSPVWDSTVVHDIQVSMDPSEFAAMVQTYIATGEKEWMSADVTIDGRTFPNAGIRLKGQSSLFGITPDASPTSLPWLIRLNKYTEQDFDGYKRFAVRSSFTPTGLNEAVSLHLLEQAGLNTTKHFPSAFSVNGETAELRLIVQEPDKTFDKEQFPAPDGGKDGGTLYKKQWDEDFSYRGDNPDAYAGAFKPKGGDEDNWQPLFDFLDWMNNATDAEFAAQLDSRIDTDAFARYLAVQDLIKNWDDIDGPGQNGYFRYTPATGQMTVVPWDHNLAFDVFPAPPRPNAAALPAPMQDDFEAAQRTTWGCPCVERALEVPAFRTLYEQTFYQLKSELYDSGHAQAALTELAAPLYQSGLVNAGAIDQDRSRIQAVFGQNLTPRTGAADPGPGPGPGDPPAGDCTAAVTVAGDWGSGWQGNVEITAGEATVDGWTLTWTWPAGQTLSSHWNAEVTTSGATVTATDVGWNGTVNAGQTIEAFGFIATGAAATPAVTCTAR